MAHFRAGGMAWAMLVTSAAVGVVGVAALLHGMHEAAYSSAFEIVGLTGLFALSGWLFRAASSRPHPVDRS